jgi:hypothetical protein
MTMETGQQVPVDSGAVAPPPDPDAAKWAELAKEVGVEPGGEPEPEPAAEPAAEPVEPVKQPTELDNLRSALKEAREANKAEQARTDAIIAALKEARERKGQQEPAKAAEPPKLPEVQEDPIGHFQGRIAQLEAALQYSHQQGGQQTQQIQQHLQEQAMWQSVAASETEIRTPGNPAHKADYDDACQHLEGARVRQLDRMYPDSAPQVQAMARQQGFATPAEFKLSLLNQDRRNVATHALQQGMSPAQLYYELALDSGYQPKANGKAPEATLAERAQQQLAAARKGTKAAVTLSGDSGGKKGVSDMTQTDLAQLFLENPDEADKVFEQMRRAGKLG